MSRVATAGPALAITADKRFGEVTALVGARLEVAPGTIHALVGENGAGKSTLLRIAFGLVRADGGRLVLAGDEIDLARHSPRAARARGLGLVQQHGALVPPLTVVENAVLGRERRPWWLDLAGPAAALARVGREVGLAIDPWARVADLPVGVAQRAEILIALDAGARILALDEPTALLTPGEVEPLFAALRALAAAGTTVILVTHKLDEVGAIADRVTVLRAGRTVATFPGDAAAAEIARAMVGAEPPPAEGRPAAPEAGAPARLEVQSLAVRGPGGAPALAIDELRVGAGEIVGVAGVEGNGQRALADAIAGLCRADGRIAIGGRDVAGASVAARRAAGLAVIAEDRQGEGLVMGATVAENLALGRLGELSPGLRLDRARLRDHAAGLCTGFDVRPADPDLAAAALSGGNQQKLVVARELSRPGLRAVVAAQPTRGVDLAAIRLIHDRLRAAAAAGAGILLISADLDEILALAHRAVVLYRGRLAGAALDPAAGDARTRLGALMTGAAS
jgi:general nucleoside transport system ATP-binding protein